MTSVPGPTASLTVQGLLDDLQATRNAEWDRERLDANAEARREVDEHADRDRWVRPGDAVPAFVLDEAEGGTVALDDLLATGPVVLLFFRFEGCPACNAALHGYQRTLTAPLRRLGAHLVAVSPQAVDRLESIKRRQGLDFPVVSDPHTALIDAFGIGFAPDEAERERSRQAGNDLGATLGTGRWTLPYPTAVVVDRNRTVQFADVHPDWMVRTESDTIVAAVEAVLDASRREPDRSKP